MSKFLSRYKVITSELVLLALLNTLRVDIKIHKMATLHVSSAGNKVGNKPQAMRYENSQTMHIEHALTNMLSSLSHSQLRQQRHPQLTSTQIHHIQLQLKYYS